MSQGLALLYGSDVFCCWCCSHSATAFHYPYEAYLISVHWPVKRHFQENMNVLSRNVASIYTIQSQITTKTIYMFTTVCRDHIGLRQKHIIWPINDSAECSSKIICPYWLTNMSKESRYWHTNTLFGLLDHNKKDMATTFVIWSLYINQFWVDDQDRADD